VAGRDETGPIHNGLPSQLPDIDPEETQEWLASLDAAVDERGRVRARYLMLALLQRARERGVGVPSLMSTDYINTIPPEAEPWFPGDEEVERRHRRWIRWNAAIMVTGRSARDLRGRAHLDLRLVRDALRGRLQPLLPRQGRRGRGDQVFIQGHASPGIYARAFLEGRLSDGPAGRLPAGALACRRRACRATRTPG
jgi:pyruvate dehydrogenase E1 component